MTLQRSLLVAGCLAAASGCAVMNMKQENEQREVRVQAKEQQLQQLQREEAALNADKRRLLSEIQEGHADADRLEARLSGLRQENAKLKAETERQKSQKQALDKRLKKYQQELSALRSDKSLSDQQKRKEIDELKEQIRLYLMMELR
ncbi:MAG TPA: hypothetical protein VJ550_02680 [Geomonas sp.]|nr:hypothetical protein [Geomonas sp.]